MDLFTDPAILLSGPAAIFSALALFIFYRRRNLLHRYADAEQRCMAKLGVPKRITDASRRFTFSRTATVLLWLAFVMGILGIAIAVIAHRLEQSNNQNRTAIHADL